MRGLTIIVATADSDRFHAALTLASAHAALGGRARLFCHEPAVPLLAAARGAHADLVATARDTGVDLLACQSGLAVAGLALNDLATGVAMSGMVGLLADLGDDRLVMA